jgi:hypothetical protein
MDQLKQFIKLFLELNPEPADFQVHALAQALACDKEALESVFYAMLGQSEDLQEAAVEPTELLSDAQEVLDDVDINTEQVPLQDLALNDGLNTNEDTGFQQETNDDGADAYDVGVGLEGGGSDVLTDDGAVDMTAAVVARLTEAEVVP